LRTISPALNLLLATSGQLPPPSAIATPSAISYQPSPPSGYQGYQVISYQLSALSAISHQLSALLISYQ
jgi:hypothetical protein